MRGPVGHPATFNNGRAEFRCIALLERDNKSSWFFTTPGSSVRKSRITEARPEKKSLFKLWVSRIDYFSMRREANVTLRIPIAKNATRIPGGLLQKSELRQTTVQSIVLLKLKAQVKRAA
jgi:hypothetical protein